MSHERSLLTEPRRVTGSRSSIARHSSLVTRHSSLNALWLASLGLYLFALLPLLAILLRVTPAMFLRHLREPVIRQALALSLGTSVAATVLCVLLGLPAAYLLARRRFPGREWLDTLVDLPITVPPVVA